MKLSAYSRTKPSGVEWLGDVPEHWTVVPFKHRCRRFAIYGANMSSDEYVPDGVRFLRTTDIDEFGQLQPEGVFIEPEQAREYLLNDQDILLSRSGTLGRAFVYRSKIHPACAYAGYLVRFVPTARLNTRFLFHFTKSIAFTDWLQTQIIASTIGNVNGQKYAQCPLPLPERKEQDLIAAFLDRETARLDALVGKKRELIEKLKEKRTALISRTVTTGLPAAAAAEAGFNPHPKLKPSGIEWLGDIPEHWQVVRWKRVILSLKDFGSNGSFAGLRENVTYLHEPDYAQLIRLTDLRKELEGERAIFVSEECYRYLSHSSLLGGEFLIANVGAHAGFVCEMPQIQRPATLGPNMMLARRIREDMTSTEYLVLSAQSELINSQLRMIATASSAQPKLDKNDVRSVLTPLPPLCEQRAILSYVNRETAKLDRLMEKVEAAIEKLQEYRTALITAAVTGKIDVRGTVA